MVIRVQIPFHAAYTDEADKLLTHLDRQRGSTDSERVKHRSKTFYFNNTERRQSPPPHHGWATYRIEIFTVFGNLLCTIYSHSMSSC